MIKSNYHIHSNFCDGHNSLSEMAESAYNRGLTSIGFTSHFTVDYENDYTIKAEEIDNYLEEIERLKCLYQGKMDIYRSFEIDYFMRATRRDLKRLG